MDHHRIPPNTHVDLSKIESRYTGETSKKEGQAQLKKFRKELIDLQELLFAENKRQLLIVLQGIDTSGKDGTIRHVFGDVNPQGTRVVNFKVPTRHDLAHDYLWRVHQHTPAKGEIVIFNRSHYEDVLVVRVHNLVPNTVWSKRYLHINEFERLLADEGAIILKFLLHISKRTQAERFLARLDRPDKNWKFNPDDLEERKHWQDYQAAFEAMLSQTSTPWAPWYVIPSDRKWYRNLAVASVIVETLKGLDMQFPTAVPDIESYRGKLEAILADDPT
ncbi:MAG TPA: polyphosphate kinase 2 family protein [Brevefilum sp.]|nr:polyphosphate kinase 2 family protein [Brevefilum sp.]HOR20053.1 polyphosphate kinase 2 family protein [Brevefilum sp.]HPL69276.1 polyphosphate kinase 2 family protein [Brevefilum sp.]